MLHVLKFIPLALLYSCIVAGPGSGTSKRAASYNNLNSPSSVDADESLLLLDNPTILSGYSDIDASKLQLGQFLSAQSYFITDAPYLALSCLSRSTSCVEGGVASGANPIEKNLGTWAYPPSSSEFLAVNTFYHVNKTGELLWYALENFTANFSSTVKSIPASKTTWWFSSDTPLLTYSEGTSAANAYFQPASTSLVFGSDAKFPGFKFAQDPTVIFHETGHALTHTMFNLRNSGLIKSELYAVGYDELGMIAEGLSDYISYLMTGGRTQFAEWGLGRYYKQSRPMREDNSLHAGVVAVDEATRLSYPTYINYDPNFPTSPFEDIHYSGQIVSHFMVALTELVEEKCTDYSLSKSPMDNYLGQLMLYLLSETLGEIGDQTAVGRTGKAPGFVNNSAADSFDWIHKVHPLNMRKFSQVLAKNILEKLPTICGANSLNLQDEVESLLDSYGLLLFDSYNNDGGASSFALNTNKKISATNRQRTAQATKDKIILDPTSGAYTAYIFDERAQAIKAYNSLVASGQLTSSAVSNYFTGTNKMPYNNNNSKISPGEFVGLSLNLYNNSNISMGGVQLLANDWKHFQGDAPCLNMGDNFPLASEGGITCNAPTSTPICMVQTLGESATSWTKQSTLQDSMELDVSKCLDPSDPESCFVRIPVGVDQAYYSKISSKKTWYKTMFEGTNKEVKFQLHNLIYMEVNPNTPPGTTFLCRFRARFTNCKDCFHDSTTNDDYLDSDFGGHKPFKIINFKFTVTD